MNGTEQTTLLIVDDDPANLELLFNRLSQASYKVLVAEAGEQALDQINLVQPEAVLLDVRMPGIDGFETCRRLKATLVGRDIPVIFMTALDDVADKLKGFEVGGVDYVTKPFHIDEVLARLKTHLTLRQLQQQLQAQNTRLQQEIVERRQVEERLRQSEERYRAVIEDQTELISRFQADGSFLFVNEVYCRFFGKQNEELLGQKWQPVAFPEDIPAIEAKLSCLSPTQPVVIIENRVYSGSGEVHWMQFINRGFFDPGGKLIEIQSVGRDITEQKAMEEALHRAHDELEMQVARRTAQLHRSNQSLTEEIKARERSETDLRALLNTIPDLMFRIRDDGVFLDYQAPQQLLLFVPPSQFLGKKIQEVLPAEVAELGLTSLKKALQTEEIQIFEYQLLLQGERRYQEARVVASGPDEALIIVRDIHERKRAELQRHQAVDQRLRLLEFSRVLLTTLSLARVIDLTQAALAEDIPHDTFGPYWLDETAGLLQPMVIQEQHWSSLPETQNWPIPLGQGILGSVAQTGQAEYINQAHLDPRSIYPPGQREQLDREHLMALPLWGPEKMIGLLALNRITSSPFTSEEFELAQLFVGQAALALHNAYLYAETQRSLQEQTALRRAGALISSTLDLNTVLYHIAEQLGQVLDATSVFISDYNPEAATAIIVAEYITPQACPEEQISVLGVTYHLAQVFPDDLELLQTGQPRVRQVDDPALSVPQRQHLAHYGCKTVLDIPMQVGGQSIAYASIWESRRRREFSAEEIALGQAIAQQGAVSLQNARLHQAEQGRYREAEALRHAALALVSTIDLDQLLQRILIELKQVVPYDSASIQLLKGDELEIIGGYGFADLSAVIGLRIPAWNETRPNIYVLSSLEPVIIEDIKVGPLVLDQEYYGAPLIRAWLGVPLIINNRPIGMFTLDKHQSNFYTQAHAQTAQAYAAQAAIALENARLYQDLQNQMQTLQATQAQLIQQERMAALGRLIASIAHEINNPLQAIQGFFSLLAEELSGRCRPEKIDYYLNITGAEIERIAGIIDRMRSFYRPANRQSAQPGSLEDFYRLAQEESQTVEIHMLLESVLQLIHKRLQQAQIKVEQVWAETLPPLQAHPDFLKQVFLNLILNAIDAMEGQRGTLRIETGISKADPQSDQPHSFLRVEFKDSGRGMSPEVLSRLFEPLFSTKEYGSGFGLFTSYQIIQAHQGQITVTSEIGQGTTFTILLPLKALVPEPSSPD